MSTVQDMLERKDKEVWSIAPDQSVLDAIARMADRHVGALTVLDGGRLVGIISERDYARKVILGNKPADATKVSEIMTPEPVVVTQDMSVENCMALMSSNRIRHLPVVDGDSLVGIIAVDDVLRAIIHDQEIELETLESYVRNDEGGSG